MYRTQPLAWIDLHKALQLAHACIDMSSGDVVRLHVFFFVLIFLSSGLSALPWECDVFPAPLARWTCNFEVESNKPGQRFVLPSIWYRACGCRLQIAVRDTSVPIHYYHS